MTQVKLSKADKSFDMIKYATNVLGCKRVEPSQNNDNAFIVCETIQSNYDGLKVFPKDLTGAERDEVAGDLFKQLPNYEDWKKYGATELLMVVHGLNKTQAKNKALEYIKHDYSDIVVQEQEQEQEQEGNNYLVDSNNKILKVWENMSVLLANHNISVRYNEMSKRIEFMGIDHKEDMAGSTFTRIKSLALMSSFKISKDDVYDFVETVADNNRFNPIANYLLDCKAKAKKGKYDEVQRLLNTIKYATTDNDRIEFCNKMLTKWFVNCVHIAFNELGSKRSCEIVPTFQGKQGKGKSKWAQALVPYGYFKGDVILNLESKDSISDALGNWIVELGEISGTFKRSENNKLKAFISATQDTWRSAYGRCSNTYPRRTCFIATVNDKEFLVDKTGNRRYFVIPADSLDYKHDINIDLFWGQVMHMYDEYIANDEPFYMTQEEQEQNEVYNSQYTCKTDTELMLDDLFDWDSEEKGACKLADIVLYVNNKTNKNYSPNAIKKVLQENGCEYSRFTAGAGESRKQDRYWKIPFIKDITLPF